MIEDFNRNIITQVEKLKSPYKQEIKFGYKDPVAVSRRRLPYSQREEIYSRLSLSRTFKGPGDLFEIEKVRDIENLTK